MTDVGQDLPGALALFDKAELAGPREAATLDGKGKSFVLTRMGRIDEAIARLKRQIALDPGNGNLYHDWSANARAALRPLEAMRVIDLEIAQERPGGLSFAGYRADIFFANTGDIGPWRASEPEARRNDWFLTLLSGAASVFAGDHAKGQAAASAALSLIPASCDALNRRYAAYLAARVYAWSGAADPSVALLEEITAKVPGVGPATIIRDPLFTIPLKDNPRYQTLKVKLEAQRAATKLK